MMGLSQIAPEALCAILQDIEIVGKNRRGAFDLVPRESAVLVSRARPTDNNFQKSY
jgi:hypothetical protein